MLRTIGLAAGACLITVPAFGQTQLRGEWKITIPGSPAYVGSAKIDAERRTVWVDDYGKEWRGYVASLDSGSVEFVITGGAAVARITCSAQSSDLLHCQGKYTDGRTIGNTSILSRTERPAPKNLAAPSR